MYVPIHVIMYVSHSNYCSPPCSCQDMEGAMSPSEISSALGLSALKNRTWAIFKTSAIKGEGLEEAMEWLVINCMFCIHVYTQAILVSTVCVSTRCEQYNVYITKWN